MEVMARCQNKDGCTIVRVLEDAFQFIGSGRIVPMPPKSKSGATEALDSNRKRWTPSNPLGMIALFVFLIETVATFSLRTVADKPVALVLVWFIVLFPIGIAATFFFLLWFKREALYGPMDLPKGEFSRLLLEIRATELKVQEARNLSTKQMFYNLGESHRLQGNWKDARLAFQKAIELDSRNTSALLGLADTGMGEAAETSDEGKKRTLFDEAIQYRNKAVKIDPQFAPIYMTRATVNATIDLESPQVRKDLEHADNLDRGLREFIAQEKVFRPLQQYDWFRSRFLDTKEEGV